MDSTHARGSVVLLSIGLSLATVPGIAATPGAEPDRRPAGALPNAGITTTGTETAVIPRINVRVPHEALPHSGMDEWPHDLDGPTPAAIDEMVVEACGL